MSKKLLTKVLAIATGAILFAGMFTAGVGAPAKMVAASPSAVDASVKTALKGCFDSGFYAEKYSDVKNAIGTNADALFNHFINNGMHEGRMVNAKFDPKAYQAAYADVAKYAGGDFCKVYEHYVKYGMNEGRSLTTYEAINAANVAAPAPSSSSSSSKGNDDGDKKKVDIGYGITVYLTKEEMQNSHIEVVKSDYGYGAFLVDNNDDTRDIWLGGTDYYFPFEGGKVVQNIDLSANFEEVGKFDGNDIATNYIPTKGSATIITEAYSNGIPTNFIPWAENEALDWRVDEDTQDTTLYGVTVGFGDYNQAYAQTAVDIWSPDTWFNEHTETETFEHAGAFVFPW